MRLTAAADASREREREKERERERERDAVAALYRPFDDGASTVSAGYGLLARAAVKKAADRRNQSAAERSKYAEPVFCRLTPHYV